MSKYVDVLSSMDCAAQQLDSDSETMGHGQSEVAEELLQARAAVAELIEAVESGKNETFGLIVFDERSANGLRAALARVKGE